jgi:hypothetical protein
MTVNEDHVAEILMRLRKRNPQSLDEIVYCCRLDLDVGARLEVMVAARIYAGEVIDARVDQ